MKYTRDDELKMVRFLRYRLENPVTSRRTFMTYKSIGRFLNKSEYYVHRLCKKITEESG